MCVCVCTRGARQNFVMHLFWLLFCFVVGGVVVLIKHTLECF